MRIEDYDFHVGDIVQIGREGGRRAGAVGEIIGITLGQSGNGLTYNVRFSDRDAVGFGSTQLRYIRSADKS